MPSPNGAIASLDWQRQNWKNNLPKYSYKKNILLGLLALVVLTIPSFWFLASRASLLDISNNISLKIKYFNYRKLTVEQIIYATNYELVRNPLTPYGIFEPRFKYLQSRIKANPNDLENYFLLGEHFLNFGQSREAISVFEDLKARIQLEKSKILLERVDQMLAISNLRLGEIENCTERHSAESCIYPIHPGGVHFKKEGAQRALAFYRDLWRHNPDAIEWQWLAKLSEAIIGIQQKPSILKQGPINRFDDVAEASDFLSVGYASGAILDDFNEDNYLDILSSGGKPNDKPGKQRNLQLFLNNGTNQFMDESSKWGLDSISSGLFFNQTDFNNDGKLDVLVLRGGWTSFFAKDGKGLQLPFSLLENTNGHFRDITKSAGLLRLAPTQAAAWLDFNGDGLLDLFVAFESTKEINYPAALYRNNGDGTFTDVAAKSGIKVQGFGKGASIGDINNDGWPDIFVSIYGGASQLFVNQGPEKDFSYREIGKAAGIKGGNSSFSNWIWDYDNDGWEDLMLLAAAPFDVPIEKSLRDASLRHFGKIGESMRPHLFHNNHDGTFTDVTLETGLGNSIMSMGSNFGDFNNDGWLDFYVGTGGPDFSLLVPNLAFLSNEGKSFTDITEHSGLGHLQKGHAISFGDFDNNGSQDILASMGGAYPADFFRRSLFKNPNNSNSWLKLKLVGTESNRQAVGARIRVTVVMKNKTERNIYHRVSSGSSFGASTLRAEIGLGQIIKIKEVRVEWPNRKLSVSSFRNILPNKFYVIEEDRSEPRDISLTPWIAQ